ncbi:bifunctional [glutamate--ammonia ligase]-adenylyl-L-tyrosine phosphorylase/[glutamate--ammonia-ligase] adenylyltransferase [Haliangium ochraceum]|uniref:Glutamate-ammonia ligase adenylyltransferase n=1 Tax=Haliangium ochraceum (strain DSM 14365 / JCM 11303 / SMP-2) TaxID=502025 RepID=D0LH39_HALO1|nr:bifunctional [glutamate--ammonia ligase]-adenylyl-L-tyrosine phosphorylase/[glutamate--ammonia-ligase] adenylyltransferase [Haliangium ochraceum]ACY18184.1 glutamate-ammonia ligase adenylyltransferase [Haliangium ochraceum DSM 14365]
MSFDVAAGAPDPRDAGLRCERIFDAAEHAGLRLDVERAEVRTVLALCCQRAPYLALLLGRDPARLERVAGSAYLYREKPVEVMARELAQRLAGCDDDDVDGVRRALRRYRADELVRLGVRELALGNPSDVGRELAHLADVAFDAAIEVHDRLLRARYGAPRFRDHDGREHDARLVVIAMGKHGGEELNFSSDVDVIYIYTSDAGAAGSLSLHEYFAKLCKQVTATISEVTEEDVVFRVDLRLRPEGSRGAIANSLPSTERYYETWGRPWERQAWLKARPCAGDLELGAEVMSTLAPFIHPRSTSSNVIDEVYELNQRIKRELGSEDSVDGGFDLKNGEGGIREIEFFVQALQLIHAGRQPALRARSTLVALDQMLFAGLVSEHEHRALSESYRFLRRAEHVLQLESGRQTQRLPRDAQALEVFARRLGLTDSAALRERLDEITSEVGNLFDTLGAPEPEPASAIAALIDGDHPDEPALLAKLGFRDPETALRLLEQARRRPLSPFSPSARGPVARIAPELVSELASSPDPDQALRYLSELVAMPRVTSTMWRLFDENPVILRLLMSLFGTSAYLAKYFVQHPELIDLLVDAGRRSARRTPAALSRSLDEQLAGASEDDEEELWNRLALFKNAQILRIALSDIAGELDCEEVCEELSLLADMVLGRVYEFVRASMEERHGLPRERESGAPAVLAVLALGKLGGRELGYASDLDVIFVYSGDGESDGRRSLDNVTYMTRLAQRLMSALHAMHPGGRLYELDTRLRPSGSQGLLVSSLSAWHKYHQGRARTWERQALTKLRAVAGDEALGARVAEAARAFVYQASVGDPGEGAGEGEGEGGEAERVRSLAEAITSMRVRIERELAGPRGAQDIKTGRGGIIDIEFASQFLQLAHGPRCPDLRTPSTVAALRAAAASGVADDADCELLIDGYRFLRTLEHRMRIVHDRSVQRLPSDPDELDKLARRAGFPDADSLQREYLHFTHEIRCAYDRVLGVDER